MPEVLVDDSGAVRRLVLNRPDKRNALDHRTIEALLSEFERAERDETVNVVVLVGSGAGFSAGADLREASGLKDARAIAHHAELMSRLLLAPWQLSKPVIAEVHGFALGAGFGLTLSCDMALCSDDAILSFPEIRHDMIPALVAPPLLRRVGYARAFEILATAKPVSAEAAMRLGLVKAVPQAALRAETTALADALAASGTILRSLKELLRGISDADMLAAAAIAKDANVTGKLQRLAGETA